VYTLLSIYLIFPETRDVAIDEARKQMEKQGKMSDDQIDQAIEMTKKFFLPFAIGGSVIGTLIVGAIASLLGAAFAKKKPISPFDQQPVQ
jgi:ABC-type antimicrobial peptide transport system permease subunit